MAGTHSKQESVRHKKTIVSDNGYKNKTVIMMMNMMMIMTMIIK